MKKTGQGGGELNETEAGSKVKNLSFEKPLNVLNLFIRLFLRITVQGAFIIEKSYHYCFLTLTVFCSHKACME